jgi:hypothetical protein
MQYLYSKQAGPAVMLLTCTKEVLGLNLACYPDWGFHDCIQSLQANAGMYIS